MVGMVPVCALSGNGSNGLDLDVVYDTLHLGKIRINMPAVAAQPHALGLFFTVGCDIAHRPSVEYKDVFRLYFCYFEHYDLLIIEEPRIYFYSISVYFC